MIESLERAVRILDLFSTEVPEWTAGAVSRELGLPRTTTWEWMQSMSELGLLKRTGRGSYRLGWRSFQLGQRARMASEIAARARRTMAELGERWGETTHLAVLHGIEVVYLEKDVPPKGVRVALTRPGERLPAHCTAEGKALLAQRSDDEVRQLYLDKPFTRLTSDSPTDLDALLEDLHEVRRTGHAEDREGVLEGLCAVAAPIRSRHGDAAWALSIAFLEYRWDTTVADYTSAVVTAAEALSVPDA